MKTILTRPFPLCVAVCTAMLVGVLDAAEQKSAPSNGDKLWRTLPLSTDGKTMHHLVK